MNTIVLCSIFFVEGVAIGLFLGSLLSASRDREIAKDCIKCREEIKEMAKKLYSAGKGEEIDN